MAKNNNGSFAQLESAISSYVRNVVSEMFLSTVTEIATPRTNPHPSLTGNALAGIPRKKRRYKRRKSIALP